MKATKIFYKKLFNLGNYQNEEIGIEVEIEDGESASDAVRRAKTFINAFDPKNAAIERYNKSREIITNKEIYNYGTVVEAERFVAEYESNNQNDDLPF